MPCGAFLSGQITIDENPARLHIALRVDTVLPRQMGDVGALTGQLVPDSHSQEQLPFRDRDITGEQRIHDGVVAVDQLQQLFFHRLTLSALVTSGAGLLLIPEGPHLAIPDFPLPFTTASIEADVVVISSAVDGAAVNLPATGAAEIMPVDLLLVDFM